MDKFWGELKDLNTEHKPEDILKEQFDILYNSTNGVVIGQVEKYDQNIEAIISNSIVSDIDFSFMTSDSAQRYLGETDDSGVFTYEVCLSAKGIPNYKYRFMFIQHGLAPYPTKLIIEDDIAKELRYKGYMFECKDEKVFITLLAKILKTNRIMSIVSRLNTYK